MSKFTVLTDAELDVVAGGILNAGDGTGGDGGTANNGANLQATGGSGISVSGCFVDLSTRGRATANGGNGKGGSVVTVVAVRGR